jgi:predicted HAD superfamily Cof-like phosphohydrolase
LCSPTGSIRHRHTPLGKGIRSCLALPDLELSIIRSNHRTAIHNRRFRPHRHIDYSGSGAAHPVEDGMTTDKPYRPQEDIVTLMKQFDQQVKDAPELPDPATRLLRARLVFEEALEFVKGCGCTVTMAEAGVNAENPVIDDISVVLDPNGTPDLTEYVDGCIDQLVVTYGALNAAGIKAQPAWDEVQRSNMSKAWPHCSVCDAVLERGAGAELVHPKDAANHNDDWTTVLKVHKRPDGKFIKAPTYSPADLKRVIDEQMLQAQSQ